MTDVGFGAVTMDFWGIAADDAQVVEHGGGLDEIVVEREFGVLVADAQCLVGHVAAVGEQQRFQFALALAIIMVDDDPIVDGQIPTVVLIIFCIHTPL